MTNLTHNLYTKHPLRFGTDGKFKILQLSDFQENLSYDPRSLDGLCRILDAEYPDLVQTIKCHKKNTCEPSIFLSIK